MRRPLRERRIAFALLATALLASAGCGAPPEAPAAPDGSYEIRGEIVRLPPPGTREITIRHEAVPEFRDEAGKVVGMEAMTMPFTLAALVPQAALDGLQAGDRVAFTLEMRWRDPRAFAQISSISKLPAGARLSWEETPPAPSPALPGPARESGPAPQQNGP